MIFNRTFTRSITHKRKSPSQGKADPNAGFSLLEVLVAMLVLAMVAIPLMRGFVLTARLNARTRQTERANAIARNLMESIKPYTVEEVSRRFNSSISSDFIMRNQILNADKPSFETGEANDSLGVSLYDFVRDGAVYEGGAVGSDRFLRREVFGDEGPSTVDGQFVGRDDDRYTFAIQNIYHDGQYYDALLELDTGGLYKESASTAAGIAYNSDEYSAVAAFSAQKDCMLLQEYTDDQKQFHKLRIASGDSTLSDEEIGRVATRTIEVTINRGDSSASVDMNISYSYGDKVVTVPYAFGSYAYELAEDGSVSETLPRNIFICYKPDYYSTQSNKLDKIIINNEGLLPVNVCIVKQKYGESSTLASDETAYHMDVEVNEGTNSGSSVTRILTNLGKNLAFNPDTAPSLPTQVYYHYRSSVADVSGYPGAELLENVLTIKGLDNASSMDRIYDTTIRIYNKGWYADTFNSGNALYSGYEDDALLSLTGVD